MADSYFRPQQWLSYLFQVETIRRLGARRVLEVGVGNGIVAAVLRQLDIEVVGVDVNPALRPDVVADVCDLERLGLGRFDAVLCAEVLEHVGYERLETCVRALHSVCGRHVLVTLPRCGRGLLWCYGRIPRLTFDISVVLPRHRVSSVHHWEMDASRATSRRNLEDLLGRWFTVLRSGRVTSHPHQYYFLLERAETIDPRRGMP